MLTCERCGAGLPPSSEQCAYCGTVSERARVALAGQRVQEQQHASQAAAQAAMLRQTAFSATEQAASKALLWGLLSFVFFCLPIPSVLSWVAFNRAARTARDAGVPVPARAKIGLACAAVMGLAAFAFWIWVVIAVRDDDARVAARKAALGQQITQHGNNPQLDQPFACALAESYLLSNGFAGSTSVGSFRGLNCAGAVRVVKDRAELGDFKLRTSSSSDMLTATICFKHGERWFVDSAGTVSCGLDAASRPPAPTL